MKRLALILAALLFLLMSGQAQQHLTLDLCQGEVFFWPGHNNGQPYNTGGTFIDGNDTLTIHMHQPYHKHIEGVVCQYGTYTDHGFFFDESQTSTIGIIEDSLVLNTVYYCDSVIHLTLTVRPLPNVHASSDTVIFGNSATLNLQVNGTAQYYVWELNNGITQANCNNTTQRVTVNHSTEYIVTGYVEGNDLVNNGHFTLGNTGFTSSYTGHNTPGSQALWNEGTYAVGTDASNWHENFRGAHDHTTGNGNYMIINGATGSNTVVWSQSIDIEPYTYYVFNTWVTTVCAEPWAQLQFSINGGVIGNIFSAPNNYSANNQWLNFYNLWYNNSPARTATISIVNQNITASGNDFGLDDISFCKLTGCGVTDTIQILFNTNLDTTICRNSLPLVWNGCTFTAENYETPQFTRIHREEMLDSAITMRVHLFPTVQTPVLENIHEDELPHTYNNFVFNEAVTDSILVLTDQNGCDSLISYTLEIRHNTYENDAATICENYAPYLWHGMRLYHTGTYTDTIFNNIVGDTIYTLNLTVIDTMLNITNLTDNFCDEMSAILSVTSAFENFVWSNGETSSQITVLSPGTYSVTATSDHCEITRSYNIPPCQLNILLPNAITPSNADGHNDYFYIDESQQRLIQDFEIYIYNRWGNLVFYSKEKDFRWNNLEENVTLDEMYRQSVYSYLIKCTDLRGTHHAYKGSIVVL